MVPSWVASLWASSESLCLARLARQRARATRALFASTRACPPLVARVVQGPRYRRRGNLAARTALASLVEAGKLGRMLRRWTLAASTALAIQSCATVHASVVERVVAVVGERPILLSDLRHRARPFLARIVATTPRPAQQAGHETEMLRELLNRMIDDRLEESAADQARLSVTPEEVDRALENVAGQAKVTIRALIAEAARQGLTEQDYRDELRRQVLEGKLVSLRVRGRVRVTDGDAHATYERWAKDYEDQLVDVRIIAMRIQPGSSEAMVDAKLRLAQQVVARARSGEDFCSLFRLYSQKASAARTCGATGPVLIDALQPPLQSPVRAIKDGETADPIRFDEENILIVHRSKVSVPPFDDVKSEMSERAFGEAMERERKAWLHELRRGLYVDLRL